ncbi:MAG: hypothetical protein ACP5M4_02405 [Acidobacteriaceae bacterium]
MALSSAAEKKGGSKLVLVVTQNQWGLLGKPSIPSSVTLIDSAAVGIRNMLSKRPDIRLVSGK